MELGLRLEHTFHGVSPERPDQLVLQIGHARVEAEGFQRLVSSARNGERECTADMPLVGDVVHAAEVCLRVVAHEVRKHTGKVRYTTGRPDLDLMQAQVATDEVGQRANRGGIAFALDEHKGTNRWRGCQVCHRSV